jgi:hypothetical protein
VSRTTNTAGRITEIDLERQIGTYSKNRTGCVS